MPSRRSRPATSAPDRPRPPDDDAADRAVGFFRDLLCHTKGEWAGRPFTLLPWQEHDIIRPLFGTLNADGRRRYRRAYIEIPRKNGKSSLAAGIALYLLLADNEPAAEVYSAAVDREQARIVFATAREMIEANPLLTPHVQIFKNAIVRPMTGATYKVLSADAPTKHGLNPSGIIVDELHALPNRDLWDILTTAPGTRRQPLTIAITTAGYDRLSLGWEQHTYALGVRDGTIDDPTFLPVIYAANQDDDWTEPATWARANPSLDETIKRDYLEQECRRARESPAYENTFKRYHLNLWTEQSSRWLPIEAWLACSTAVSDADLRGAPAFGGLDLGETDDLSALALVFLLPDGRVAVRARHWAPESVLTTHPHRPYVQWQRQGALVLTQGTATDFPQVQAEVEALARQYDVREIAFDPRFARQMAQHLEGQGLLMVEQPQGYQLNEPLRRLLALARAGTLCHGGEPMLAWEAANMVVHHGQRGELRPDKQRASEKIDGMVALVMALGRAILRPPEETSAYADHGLVTV